MSKFEYITLSLQQSRIYLYDQSGRKTELTGITIHPLENIMKLANEYGRQGWEVIAYSTMTVGINMVFKREMGS